MLLEDAEMGALSHADLSAHLRRVQAELLGRVRAVCVGDEAREACQGECTACVCMLTCFPALPVLVLLLCAARAAEAQL